PEKVEPDEELKAILKKLSDQPQNAVVIISGRKREILEKWFGDLNVDLVGEHGVWLRINDADWELIEKLENNWKNEILPILDLYVDRTPGSYVETKDYSLVWHYRKADPGQGIVRARELVDHLVYLTSNLSLQVLEGNKVVEVKTAGVNKGRAAFRWIALKNWDFILALGDDWTDEDIFRVLPKNAYSIKVGIASTEAKYKIKSPKEVRTLLTKLAEVDQDEGSK
ncbi:MAG: trehalose-phosphatase, partial [bacterium]|nr:trehalose-phosphatase [bacterium]